MALRIVEIGDRVFAKLAAPEDTWLIWTGARRPGWPPPDQYTIGSLRALRRLKVRLSRGEFDLVICHAPRYGPWHWRHHLDSWKAAIAGDPGALWRGLALAAIRSNPSAPMAILDQDDTFAISSFNVGLLRRAGVYFKRELPIDFWPAYSDSLRHQSGLPSRRVRLRRSSSVLVEALRPISIGLPPFPPILADPAGTEKTIDLFFAGSLDGYPMRTKGVRELYHLREQGRRVEIHEGGGLPYEEYARRMRQSWLIWSPPGMGWDCYRHHEAAACAAVPILSRSPNYLYQPYRDREHCYYYDPDGAGLSVVVQAALANRERLAQMGAAAREHALRHHSWRALVGYVARETLASRPGQ